MAQIEIINLRKLSSAQGYVMPANTPGLASADNITHAQLRKSPFSSVLAQGTLVSGQTSTFEFSIPDADADELLKLYVSTDGSTYTEDATYGGTNGKNPFGSVDLSTYVTTNTAQSITATKTINTNANLVIASGSDITVQTGGDITLADAPTASTDATNKAYVDGLVGYKSCVFWVSSYTPNESTALSYTRIYNNTGYTPTLTYLHGLIGVQGLRVTFNRTSSNSDIILPPKLFTDDGFGSKNDAGFFGVSETFSQSSANTTMDLYYIDDTTQMWNVSQGSFAGVDVWSTFTLSGGTLTRAAGTNDPNTNQKFLAATKDRLTNLLVSSAVVVTSEARLNFRIELRFYD